MCHSYLVSSKTEYLGFCCLFRPMANPSTNPTHTFAWAVRKATMSWGALFSVMSLPLLLPLLIFLIQGTTAVSTGDLETYSNSMRAVLSMGGAMTVASVFLFPVVWRD